MSGLDDQILKVMEIRQFRSRFIQELAALYDEQEAQQFFNLAVEEKLGLTRSGLALSPQLTFTGQQLKEFEDILEKLHGQVPIQYILGVAWFCGRKFKVTGDVLVPRPETEELVDWIVKENANSAPRIIDIGTGSGCIAISLAAQLPFAEVSAIDISPAALSVAALNAEENKVNLNFIQEDVLKLESLDGFFDIIVSNPPYVTMSEKSEIKKNVLDHEPHLALFVPDSNPLLFYKKIADLAFSALNPKGTLYFEINQYLGRETVLLLKEKGFGQVELRQDIYGNDRMVKACR